MVPLFWTFDFGQQYYKKWKNETRKKLKNLLGINFVKYSYKFLEHIKKHLGHTGTPTNVQNNCIKLSGWASNQIFKKGGIDRTSTFRGGCWESGGWLFSGGKGGCNFHTKNKLKSEIFNGKQSL